jgi:hypothetical protein
MGYCAIFHKGKHLGTLPQKSVAYAAIEFMKDELKMLPPQIENALPSLKSIEFLSIKSDKSNVVEIIEFWSATPDRRHVKKLNFGSYGSRFCITNGWHFNLINDLKSFGFFIAPITKQKLGRHDFYTSIHATEFIRENRLPLTKNSMNTFRGNMESLMGDYWNYEETTLRSPNLCLNRINSLIMHSKSSALHGSSSIAYHFFLGTPNNYVNQLVKNIPVCIVTENDKGVFLDRSHFSDPILTERIPIPLHRHIDFSNNPLNQSELEPIKIPEPSRFDEESISTEALGMYLQKEGIIFIWIDRIKKCAGRVMMNTQYMPPTQLFASYNDDPTGVATLLLFQEVLLHEFFHAFFDIHIDDNLRWQTGKFNPNYQSSVTINGQSITINEETIDNALVLLAYDWFAPKLTFDFVYNFVNSQPKYYREAADMYRQANNFYHTTLVELIKLLETK